MIKEEWGKGSRGRSNSFWESERVLESQAVLSALGAMLFSRAGQSVEISTRIVCLPLASALEYPLINGSVR